jgi:putative MATE family efflux protein
MIADTAMVGRLGAASIAATGAGGVIFQTVITLILGGSMGLQIIVSHRIGEGHNIEAGRFLGTGLWMSVIIGGVLMIGGMYFSEDLISVMSQDTEVKNPGSGYLFYRFASSIPLFMIFMLRAFFDGFGDTRPGMISSFAVAFVNILLNLVFIFGRPELGIPAMGVKGAAIASLLATIPGILVFIPFFFRFDVKRCFSGILDTLAFRMEYIRVLMRLSTPPSLEHSLMHLSFVVFTVIAAKNGIEVLAATQIIVAILSLSFMPGFAFGTAATTLVGQAMGKNSPLRASASTWRCLLWAVVIMSGSGVIFIVFSDPILRLFTVDPNVLKESLFALIVIAIVQPFDAMNMVFAAALRSAGLVRWVLGINLVLSWGVMLPLSYLGTEFIGGSAPMWAAVSFWIFLLALIYGGRFIKGDWKEIHI